MRPDIDEMVLRIFQREVVIQCRFALMAEEDLEQSLRTDDMDRTWYSAQAVLVAAGNISKILWPVDSLLPERGPELRATLDVGDKSPLQPRAFRNHFEHFDSRIEQWASSSERHNFADWIIGPSSAFVGLDPGDILRLFDPGTWEFTFRGDKYALRPVIESIRELWKRASVEAAKWP